MNYHYEKIEKTISIITMLETYRKLYLYNVKESNYFKEKCIGLTNKVKVLQEQLLLCQKELEEVRHRNKDHIPIEAYKKLQRDLKEKDKLIDDKTNKNLKTIVNGNISEDRVNRVEEIVKGVENINKYLKTDKEKEFFIVNQQAMKKVRKGENIKGKPFFKKG